ncbi:aspartate kinase [Fomitiporia mediterranea MF3/22]|uniref:aspartate kinase n=1 Tax=Fomitiporia mediterranea (strain MF3/22) TaxID=694068 RepID=UPI000440934C|nr:aspartate kinase [Fomitiporia mediterranea MF3/22]EJD05577.1 aspartate kinase [Fomitiporia mediterranea MF3/22]
MSSSPSNSRDPSPPDSSDSLSDHSTMPSAGPLTPSNLHQNSIDPAATWIVQKYGGTSVGKFAEKIAAEIVPTYLDQHKVAIVCSARSGSTKALGTTNLLLRAASEALQRSQNSPLSASGISSPQLPVTVAGIAHNKGFLPRSDSISGMNGMINGSVPRARAEVPSPGSPRSSSPSPFSALNMTSISKVQNGSNSPASFTSQPFQATVDILRSDHLAAAQASVRDPELLKELEAEIDRDCEGLRSFLFAAQIIDEISPRSRDNIVGVGERLACKLVAAVLRDRGIDSEYVSLENIVPVEDTDEGDGERVSDSEFTTLGQSFYDRVAEAVGARIRQCGSRVPVITGFFGPVPGSLLRQVGRGYTDLLSALAAVGLQASELQIWKEVDGIFTADPRKVHTARLIPIISPDEAAELTYYGSEVVHPFTMEQVIRRKIPIRIKNVENPLGSGTVIHPDPNVDASSLQLESNAFEFVPSGQMFENRKKLPTAVTIKERITVLNVHSNRKSVSHGFFARIFGTLDRFGVVVDLISTSEVHVSMAIENNLGKRMMDRLVRELEKSGSVSVTPDMAILSLVGKQQRNLVGISGRMFSSLAEGNINIEMISQGASEINISCVIDGRDAVKALNLIHQSCLQIKPEGAMGRMGPWLF